MNSKHNKAIFFVGGLTAGPIAPLLTVARKLKAEKPNINIHFIDVKNSALFNLITPSEFHIHKIITGKLRRYWSIKTLLAPIAILIGMVQSVYLLKKYKPSLIVGAGGYAQVPVIWTAWLLRIPSLIHQQDLTPTLSNKLCALPAVKITTAFEKSLKDFSEGFNFFRMAEDLKETKMEWIGSPTDIVQRQINQQEALAAFGFNDKLPVVLVIGGGSGALVLNKIIAQALPELTKIAQIIHSTGIGKQTDIDKHSIIPQNYKAMEFISNLNYAYSAADLVISRAGIGAITELSALSKTSIIIPMPSTHQEKNAELLFQKNAAIVLDETTLTAEQLVKIIRSLFFDFDKQKLLAQNISKIFPENSTAKMIKIINELIS